MPTAVAIEPTSSPTSIPTVVPATPTPTPIPTPVVGEPVVSVPSPVDPGQQIGIAIPMEGVAGVEIVYEWAQPAGQGEILDGQGTNAITYQAPTEPGTYNIELAIRSAGTVVIRNTFVTVREKPEVPPPPPSLCDSYRPTLTETSDFPGEVEIKTLEDCTTGLPRKRASLSLVPQAIDACKGVFTNQGGGKWQVQFSLGGKDGTPEWFDIVVVLADRTASEFFKNWFKTGCETGDYPGIPAGDIQELNQIEKHFVSVESLD